MRSVINLRICFLLVLCALPQFVSSQTIGQNKRIVIAASEVLDGKGGVLQNTRIVIEGSKIVAIDPKAVPVNYDLRGLTVLPGWIDAHVHITWSFGPDGKKCSRVAVPRTEEILTERILHLTAALVHQRSQQEISAVLDSRHSEENDP